MITFNTSPTNAGGSQPQYLGTFEFGSILNATDSSGNVPGSIEGLGSRCDIGQDDKDATIDATISVRSIRRYTNYSTLDTSNAMVLSALDGVMMVFYIDRYHLQGNDHKRPQIVEILGWM